jgi:hypothetical protein
LLTPVTFRVQMRQAYPRNTLQSKQLYRLHPTMAGNDPTVLSDQNRIGEPELPNAVGDLSDLLLGMGSGIAGSDRPGECLSFTA